MHPVVVERRHAHGVRPVSGAHDPSWDQAAARLRRRVEAAFDRPTQSVVVKVRAGLFDEQDAAANVRTFRPVVHLLADLARSCGRDVYLMTATETGYRIEQPLAAGSPWLRWYGVTEPVATMVLLTLPALPGDTDWIDVPIVDRADRIS